MTTPATTDPPASRRQGVRRAVAGGLATLLVVAVGAAYWQASGSARDEDAAAADEPVLTAGDATAALCGVADTDRYAALPADSPTATVDAFVSDLSGGVPLDLGAVDGTVAALTKDGTTSTIARWDATGRATGTVTIDAASADLAPDTFALSADGDVLAADGSAGGDTVGRWAAGSTSGKPDVTYDLADLDRGRVVAVLDWTAGRSGVVASAVLANSTQLALLRADGSVDAAGPTLDWGWYARFYPQDDGSLAVLSDADASSSSITLTHYDATGAVLLSITGGFQQSTANGRPMPLDHFTGVATSADGGLLLSGPTWSLVEIGDDGVQRRQALSGEGQGSTFKLSDLTPFVGHAGSYYFVSPTDDGLQLSHVTTASLDLLLDAPVTWDINHGSALDHLGFGAGLSTDAVDDYFGPGTTPAVHAQFADWWGPLSDTYELRYRVTGDPSLDPAVEGTSGTVAIPADGASVDLDLPAARPGPYDVDAELVEKATGDVRTATCLRYAVGADGSTFDPATLADGADWGGAGPLRGVQLADQLGIGSYRSQLRLTDLVPDVTATPSMAGLNLAALPGAQDGDPFAGLAAASELADATGVQLYVQVGDGGDAENQAVADGTWGAWVTALATAFRTGAPGIHLWAPWNEPNNTGFGDGGDYVRQVQEPFAAAVRGVDPQAKIIGGNALNVVVPWYQQVIDAGGCTSMDIVGIHPYTGFNRSWDEEGSDGPIGQITELKSTLAACGTDTPAIWDTESGWWSDGPGNTWAQADDVARTSLWLRALGVDEWTYFFSEGGWGEGGFTWSLVQVGSFVKPGALAMQTASTMLDGRGAPEQLDLGDRHAHAMRFAAPAHGSGSADELTAVWTDDEASSVSLSTTVATSVTVTDVYGGTRTLEVEAGTPAEVAVGGAPVYLTAPASAGLTVTATRPTGANLLAGGTVTASSTADGVDASAVLDPEGARTSPWRAGATTDDGPDVSPWLEVQLAQPALIDRVVVESPGIRCCTAGLSAYTVSVQDADGAWHDVGTESGLFATRTSTVTFAPVTASAVRVQIPSTVSRGLTIPLANYGGQTGGLLPAWEPVRAEPTWPVGVVSLAAYGPG